MSTHAQSSSPFSRLSRLAFPFKSNPSTPLTVTSHSEDWYIPYNGPYEPPKDDRNTDSWGHLVSGWLMENEGERTPERRPRARAMSSASRLTGDEHKRKSTRFQASFIKLDQAGGVGAVPTPARPRRSQETAPVHHRTSLASILSFGSKKAHRLHHSPSAGSLRADPVPPVPQDARLESNPHSAFPLRHPYAYAIPAVPPPPASSPVVSTPSPPPKPPTSSKFPVQLLDPLARKPTAPAYLLPGRRPSKLSLKASMSTPNLRAVTGTGSALPKGKQRWLSAETWCDALILPRPRFALRVIDGEGGSGRIVSPPGSPIWPSSEPVAERPVTVEQLRVLKKSHSATQLASQPVPPSPPRPPPPPPPKDDRPVAGPSNAPQQQQQQQQQQIQMQNGNGNAHLKPYRPKSWAWDDLAVPSPAPSLSKVLEEGRKLDEDRKTWQREAAKSFADKRARSLSRARSKSIGSRAASHAREPSTFDTIAEVTLLGSQKRRPTVHIRVRPPRSDGHTSSSGGGTNTITGTGTGVATFTSTSHAQQSRTRSHGHSNSLGSVSQPRSDESFMWTPGHGRNHSLGRSALRIVRTTATTAAALCGITDARSDDGGHNGRPVLDEKAAAIEAALRHDGTKVIHLRDQVSRGSGTHEGGVVVITPPLISHSRSNEQHHDPTVGPGGVGGVSPTPSTMSASAEGVGIAIGSPIPQEDPFEKMPIRIPAHPYAQGTVYPYYQRVPERPPGKAPIMPGVSASRSDASAPSPTSDEGASATRNRQPVMVHPYSPYAQVPHPFAAVSGHDAAYTTPKPKQRTTKQPEEYLSPKSSMFAELSPGTIREILPEEIQYSPFIPTPPIRVAEISAAASSSSSGHSGHPYGPPTKRTSEWGFADALSSTMQRRGSTDSGLGTSEAHELPPLPVRPTFTRALEDSDDLIVVSPDEDPEEILNDLGPRSRSGSGSRAGIIGRRRPRLNREATQASSNHTLASSPMESINPPMFMPDRKELSAGDQSFGSSGSSPGMVSTQSSPPHSPRPINSADDLERFRGLFFRPPESKSSSSEESRPPTSRRPSDSIPIELGARSTRSLSGLTSLARQLSVSMSEMQMQESEQADEDAGRGSPTWETRYGGLAGQRPSDLGSDPLEALSQSSSRSGSRRGTTQSPLRLPIDANLMLSQPIDVVPEDVESSRASSMLELPLDEELDDVRLGEIEAVSTPSVSAQIQRFSTHLVHMGFDETELSPSDSHPHRVVSQQSSLGAPLSSDAARSSFMTNTSGMSRLSEFPAPPSQITASHLSILNAYYRDSSRTQVEDVESSLVRPALVREASHATFGSRGQMGEAL